jgi:hypothetical protein
VGYNKEDKSMDIAFHSGGNYTYKDVPKSLFDRIKRVKSPGKFFHKHIKRDNSYKYDKMEKEAGKVIMRLTSDTPLLKAVTEGLKGKKIDFSRELPHSQPIESTELYKLLERQSKIEPLYGANQIERFAPIKNEESKRFNLIGMIKNLLKPAMGVQKEAAYRNIPQHIRDLMIRRSQGDKSALEALQNIGRANAAKRARLKPIKDLINRTSEPAVKPLPVNPPTPIEQPAQLDPAEIKARFDEIRRMIGNSGQVQ